MSYDRIQAYIIGSKSNIEDSIMSKDLRRSNLKTKKQASETSIDRFSSHRISENPFIGSEDADGQDYEETKRSNKFHHMSSSL